MRSHTQSFDIATKTKGPSMTNKIAIALGLALVVFFAVSFYQGWDVHIFLGRKFADLIEYLAFWR